MNPEYFKRRKRGVGRIGENERNSLNKLTDSVNTNRKKCLIAR